ncbi:MAG: sugar ABC transporter permease [Chloroflexota bacterium]|nr:sugar ABC transporter permease [Chloroflexota bacterium]
MIDARRPQSRDWQSDAQKRWTAHTLADYLDAQFFALAATPAFVVVAGVTLVPVLIAFALSFTGYSATNPTLTFVGLQNYATAAADQQLRGVLLNTLVFAGSAVIVETLLGLGLALLLRRAFRGVGVFRTIYLIPLMVASIASATAWRALLNTNAGWVNYFLGLAHVPPPDWLASANWAMPSVILADTWTGAPVVAILLLAGLLGVAVEPTEQAVVDGANAWQVFWYITFPAIRPVFAFAVLFRVVDLFRQFPLFQIMTGGGPGLKTTVLNFYVYQNTFQFGKLGYGAALAVILVIVMAIPLVILFRFARSTA